MADDDLPPPVGYDDDEPDGEKLAKEELMRLQRQYRKMEVERLGYSIQSGSSVGTQLRRVACYEKERDEMMTNLVNLLSERNQTLDRESVRIILEIVDNFVAHQAEIEYELTQIAEMDEQVMKITKRVIHQKLKVQAIFGHSMTPAQAHKHQSILENRLYRVTTDFDSQVTRNREVRQQINNHLMERTIFYEKYRAIKRRIAKMKRHMSDLVDIATGTYDQREECVSKIKALRERNDKESRAHVLEMKEYHRLLHNDEKARSFMETKRKNRALIEEDDVRLKRQQNAKEKHFDDLLRSYRKSFREILAMSNTRDIQSLLQTYSAQENKNFTRFQYLSTLNSELDFIQRAVTELQAVVEVKAVEHKRQRLEQLKGLKLVEAEFESAVTHQGQRKEFLEKCEENLNKMLSSLQDSFKVAQCDNEPIMRLLGNKEGKIIPENVELCMKLLERKVQELQTEDAVLEIRKAVETDHVQLSTLAKYKPPAGIGRRAMGGFIKPKSTTRLELGGAGEDDEDERSSVLSQRPFTYAELRSDMLLKFKRSASAIESLQTLGPD